MRTTRILVMLGVLVSVACGTGDGADDAAPTPADDGTLTIYSGRSEELVGPLIERFEADSGIRTEVRYGDTAELAAAILEEGGNSPADVFWAQDAGALGALEAEDRLVTLPDQLLSSVPDGFRSADGYWVGTSGRARVAVYNRNAMSANELPGSVLELTQPAWRGRVGWAPTNGSFQAFVTALRVVEGEAAARSWLEGMLANDVREYPKNTPIVQAVAAGEIDLGLVNHYYLLELADQDPSIAEKAANHFFPGDAGSLINVAGVGILDTSEAGDAAGTFVEFLLSPTGAEFFADETFEYPLVPGPTADERLPALDTLDQPDLDLSQLADLEGTLELLRATGVL